MNTLPPGFVLDDDINKQYPPVPGAMQPIQPDPRGPYLPQVQPQAQPQTQLPAGFALDAPQSTPEAPQEKPFGITDTWPFRLGKGFLNSVQSAATLPGDVYAGKVDPNSDEGLLRAGNFAMLASPAAVGKLGWAPSAVTAPTEKALFDAGGAGYKYARESNVALNGKVVTARASTIQGDLKRKGFYGTSNNAPNTFAILKDLEDGTKDGAMLTAGDYINLRQALSEHAQGFNNGKDSAAATFAIKHLDELFDTAHPSYFVAGTPAEIRGVRNAIKDARANFAAGYRSKLISTKEHAADLRAAAANSGRNYDNQVRQRLAGVALTKKENSGFTPEEIAAVEKTAEGSTLRNVSRDISNKMGGGGGMAASLYPIAGAGAAAGTGDWRAAALGIGVPLAGAAIKGIENMATKREVGQLSNMLRLRSPLGEEAVQQAAEAQAKKLNRPPPPYGSQEAYRLFLLYQAQNPNET